MNVDERARQAARRLHQQAADLDTDALLARVESKRTRSRWITPTFVTALVVAVVAVSVAVLPGLLSPRPDVPIIDEPDTLPSDEPPDDDAPGDDEPTPDPGPGGGAPSGTWQRVPHGEVFGTKETREGITGIASSGGTTVAVGTVEEQPDIWVHDPGRIAENAEAWRRVDGFELCGDASCGLVDVAVAFGRFVAVGSLDGQAMIWTSEDGEEWERSPVEGDGETPLGPRELQAVAVSGSTVVAIGVEQPEDRGIHPIAAVSRDGGMTWEAAGVEADPVIGAGVVDVVAAAFGYVAVGWHGDAIAFWTSQDGQRWELTGPDDHRVFGPPFHIGGLATLGDDVVFLGGVGGGGDIDAATWRSSDARTWERLGGDVPAEGDQRMYAAAYAGGALVAVGEDGRELGSDRMWPAAWVLENGGWRVLDGGDAFDDPGSIVAAVERDGHSLIAAGTGSDPDADDIDAAIWTYDTEGAGGGEAAAGTCSAVELAIRPAEESPAQPGLPDAVAERRRLLREAALACDLDVLAQMARDGDRDFTWSFGGSGDPLPAWRRDEEAFSDGGGAGPTWWIARLLEAPYATVESQFEADRYETIYVWPSAFADGPDEEDWQALIDLSLASPNDVSSYKEFGGYTGWRIGITEDGEWVFFVAGD